MACSMNEIVNYRIKVHGRVQGIGYRYSALNMANHLSLSGYVKNLSSGAVMLELEGPYHEVHQMIEWCKTGPGTGNVDDVEIDEGEVKHYTNFEVRY